MRVTRFSCILSMILALRDITGRSMNFEDDDVNGDEDEDDVGEESMSNGTKPPSLSLSRSGVNRMNELATWKAKHSLHIVPHVSLSHTVLFSFTTTGAGVVLARAELICNFLVGPITYPCLGGSVSVRAARQLWRNFRAWIYFAILYHVIGRGSASSAFGR